MIKLSALMFLALGTLAGCTSSGGSTAWTGSYMVPAQCYSYDYAHTGSGSCIGRTWH